MVYFFNTLKSFKHISSNHTAEPELFLFLQNTVRTLTLLHRSCFFLTIYLSLFLASAPVQVLRHAGQLRNVFESRSSFRLWLVRPREEVFAETGVRTSREHLDAPQRWKQPLRTSQNHQGTPSHNPHNHLNFLHFYQCSHVTDGINLSVVSLNGIRAGSLFFRAVHSEKLRLSFASRVLTIAVPCHSSVSITLTLLI